MTGVGALDEKVTGATFDMSMIGAIGQLVHCTGDASASKTCNLPLGTGSLTFKAMTFPLAVGNVPVKVDINLSASVPASLQTTTTTCKATATGGDALFCIEIDSAPGTDTQKEWEDFKMTYGKTYNGDDEEQKRFGIFKDNYDYVTRENAKDLGYQLGINQFSDLTADEVVAGYTGLKPQSTWADLQHL